MNEVKTKIVNSHLRGQLASFRVKNERISFMQRFTTIKLSSEVLLFYTRHVAQVIKNNTMKSLKKTGYRNLKN